MKKCVFIVLLLLSGCKAFHFEPKYKRGMLFEKFYFEASTTLNEVIPQKKIQLSKVFAQKIHHPQNNQPEFITQYKKFYNLPFEENEVAKIYNQFQTSLKLQLPNIEFSENVLWTNKNLPQEYAFKSFDPNEVEHKKLVEFSEIDGDEIVFLPLLCFYTDDYRSPLFIYHDFLKIVLAIYIFDNEQIYYARSVGFTKSNFIENSINPKDTQFLQSEWDYLVYEALRPLLEKGVELEIRSKGPLTSDAGTD